MRHDTPAFIKIYTGHVELPDALNYTQLLAWEDAREALTEQQIETWGDAAMRPKAAVEVVAALCQLVKSWHLARLPERVTPETFPATPRQDSMLLIVWLIGLVSNLYAGTEDTDQKKAE